MSDDLRAEIRRLISKRRTNAAAVSKAMGRNQTYVRDFLSGKKNSINAVDMRNLERLLLVQDGYLTALASGEKQAMEPMGLAPVSTLSSFSETARKIPVFGRPAASGITMTSEPVDHVETTTPKGAFAVFIPDETMEPRYFAGELAHVNPIKPVPVKSFCLVQFSDGAPAIIRRLVAQTTDEIEVEQYNPPLTETIRRSRIKSLQKIIAAGDA